MSVCRAAPALCVSPDRAEFINGAPLSVRTTSRLFNSFSIHFSQLGTSRDLAQRGGVGPGNRARPSDVKRDNWMVFIPFREWGEKNMYFGFVG